MIKASVRYQEFDYRKPAVTSRGSYANKKVYFLLLYDEEMPLIQGIGECSVFPGLSMDDVDGFEEKLNEIVDLINKGWFNLKTPIYSWPSINFAIETALKDLDAKGSKVLYPSEFTEGKSAIPINGLIWMGKMQDMHTEIEQKLSNGFSCIKIKIGALNFSDEYNLLKSIRKNYSAKELEIRVDANGAFSPDEAPEILIKLSELELHSVEQPILPSQIEDMAMLCDTSPVPIALDEELIGKYPAENKMQLLNIIRPQYIVLKPGLLGGIQSCDEWIELAEASGIGWWITSALETNIGLNAIAQWTYTLNSPLHQGLSTGSLFENNIESPLALAGEKLYYFPRKKWDLTHF